MDSETIDQKQPEETGNHTDRTHGGLAYRPNVDILEKPDELLLLADMPGVKADEIDIRFEDGELMIHGRAAPREDNQGRYLLNEYGVGDFYRTFRVSEHIDAANIGAEYKDGVLALHLPKMETVKPRRINVKTN